jgi:predicted RNA-binding Zn-ribbon protein involved in translation (DUF1610 family)
MRGVRLALPARLQARTCLRCGYRGPELQGDQGERTYTCPACAEDLYTRPARSYAELEGLDEASPWLAPWPLSARGEGRLGAMVLRLWRAMVRALIQPRR